MGKIFVDQMIRNMKLAGIVVKSSGWMLEGISDEEMNIRYVGIIPPKDWEEIMSHKNKLLLKFLLNRRTSYLEFYLANKTPFLKITTTKFSSTDKWESLLGELKRKLKKDKTEYIHHKDIIGNLFVRIQTNLL